LEERHRNAVDATSSSNTTTMPTNVTIHMILRFIVSESQLLADQELVPCDKRWNQVDDVLR
jgi:galactose mutarotase-like enzyme